MALGIVAQSPRQWDEEFKMSYVDVVDLGGQSWAMANGVRLSLIHFAIRKLLAPLGGKQFPNVDFP
jgi:hypothetical protein